MLSMNYYEQEYVNACREKVNAQLSSFHKLISSMNQQDGTTHQAIQTFEPQFFNHMVLALDAYFCHRSRTLEKKDGNPLNEVRILCESIMNNNNHMMSDKKIKLDPAKSILKYSVGDEIKLNADDFARLSEAFFADIEKKYVA